MINACLLIQRFNLIKFIILLISIAFSSIALAKNNILIIHSYHNEHVWTDFLKQGFDNAFKHDDNTRIFHEFIDTKRYPKGQFKALFLAYLEKKYSNSHINVIAVSDDPAMKFIQANRAAFPSYTPIVYLGINQITKELLQEKNMTGVFENRNLAKTVFDIKTMTQRDELLVISDSSITGKANWLKIKAIVNDPNAPKKITLIEDLSPEKIATTLYSFATKPPILIIGQLINPNQNNELLSWQYSSEQIDKWAIQPVFTIAKTTLNHGGTGADVLDGEQHAEQAAALIKQLLNGTPIHNIPPILQANSQWTLDAQKLTTYDIKLQNTPKNAILINQTPSFYQEYKLMVWLTSLAFIVAILIILLLGEIIRRGRNTQKVLFENENRYKDLAQAGANIFWETDTKGRLSYLSGNTRLLLGYSNEEMLGHDIIKRFKNNPNIEFPTQSYKDLLEHQQPLSNIVFKVQKNNKNVKNFMLVGKVLLDGKNNFNGYRGIIKDITQEHLLSQQVMYQAAYDQLTGLINRHNFNDKLKQHLAQQTDESESSFLCFLDLDRFKLVNDTAGHLVGDAILTEIAPLINQCIKPNDVLARLGGDEFAIILINTEQRQAQATCEKIITQIKNYKYQWHGRIFDLGVSIGMVNTNNSANVTELLSKADLACYKAKELGRGRIYISDCNNQDLYNEALQIGHIANISQAINNNQFFLVRQVIKPLNGNLSPHYEILIRFKSEQGQLIPPGLFIPAAEKHGLITLIDHWVLSTILTNYQHYFPDQNTLVSINLSGISLSDKVFVENIKAQVAASKVPPQNICFEITETAVISQMSRVQKFIVEMKALGVKFALDDFGSGASSFGYLKNLPVDYLKIDGSLIQNITNSTVDQAIIKSINAIAHMMNMKTIAEFVETSEIEEILQDIGIDYVQGYGIGKPENFTQ